MAGRRIRPCARAARSPPPRGESSRLRLPASALLPLTFQHLSPLGEPSRNPFHVNAPRGQWALSGREPSTNGRGAALLDSTASPRDWLRAGSDRAAVQGWEGGSGVTVSSEAWGPAPGGRGTFLQKSVPLQQKGWLAGSLPNALFQAKSWPGKSLPTGAVVVAVASALSSRSPSSCTLARGFTHDR